MIAYKQMWAWKYPGVAEYLGGVGTKVAKEIADQCPVFTRQGRTGWYRTADLDAAVEGAVDEAAPELIEGEGGIRVQVVYVDPETGEQWDEPAAGLERREIPMEIGPQEGGDYE